MAALANWAGTQRWEPRAVVAPGSEAEVVAAVRSAARSGMPVKAVGARHSWSDIAVTDGLVVRPDRMNEVLDVGDGVVRVQGGAVLGRVVAALDAAGLALPVLPAITAQTVAGAIATATHGSSMVHGSLSSLVIGARVVTAAGDVVDVDEDDRLLDAIRVHLGALGVVTEVTMRTVPQFWLRETLTPMDLDEVIATLPQVASFAEFVKVWWFPHTRRCAVFRADRVRADERNEIPRRDAGVETVLNGAVFPAVLGLGRRLPAMIPPVSRGVGRLYSVPRSRVGRSMDILSFLAVPPRNRQTEYAVPLDRGPQAIGHLVDVVSAEGLRINFPAEIRFSAAESGWMSPALRQPSVHLGAYMAPAPDLERYFAAFQRKMADIGGRPHPGKEHDALPATAAGRQFAELARELDPDGMFENAFTRRWIPAP